MQRDAGNNLLSHTSSSQYRIRNVRVVNERLAVLRNAGARQCGLVLLTSGELLCLSRELQATSSGLTLIRLGSADINCEMNWN